MTMFVVVCLYNGVITACTVHTLCRGMISLSRSLAPLIGFLMSGLISFSTHSIVTTSPLSLSTAHGTWHSNNNNNNENQEIIYITQLAEIQLPSIQMCHGFSFNLSPYLKNSQYILDRWCNGMLSFSQKADWKNNIHDWKILESEI